jgi:hypothetical protein
MSGLPDPFPTDRSNWDALGVVDPILVGSPSSGAPPFRGTWVAYDARAPAFWRDTEGIVHLEGLAKSGAIGTEIFVLPDGFRPINDPQNVGLVFPVVSNSAFGMIQVFRDGRVYAGAGSSLWITLYGIYFRANPL